MPKYFYEITTSGDIVEIKQPITMDKFVNLKEILDFLKQNNKELVMSCVNGDIDYLNSSDEELEGMPVIRIIVPSNIHFKGMGWFTASAKAMRYTGKNKKLYDRLRDERSKRKSKNVSVADVNKELNINIGSVTGVIPDKKWDKLSNEQKNIANEYGIRQSRDYIK